MNESLLQFIWRFQYFNRADLLTVDNQPLEIIHPGTLNINQGPDFNDAKVRIGNTIWAGTIELHIKTSDWDKHQHQQDRNYQNVILHVVYENDKEVNQYPVLELNGKIAGSLLQQYGNLMRSHRFIPCENLINKVSAIIITVWKERLVAERLQRKAAILDDYQKRNEQHWEESFWWLLAKNFGAKVNADAFEAIAKSIPIKILAKHKNQLIQLEALLLGQAGLLMNDAFSDKYVLLLQREYQFLKAKCQLVSIPFPIHFLRMRPGNFPTIRLAQLAALIHQSAHLFSKVVEEDTLQKVRLYLSASPNDFWNHHYTLQDNNTYKVKPIGNSMIDNIIINTIVPTLFAYGTAHQNQALKDKALKWLEQTKPERNTITQKFNAIAIELQSAWDSQALIELKTQYCELKKCLQCSIGNAIIKH